MIKKVEEEEIQEDSLDNLALGVDDIERARLLSMSEEEHREHILANVDEISDNISHETVDSKGQMIKVMIARELASLADLKHHMSKKRVTTANAAIINGRIGKKKYVAGDDSHTVTGESVGNIDAISKESISEGGTVRKSKGHHKIGKGDDLSDGKRVETPPEFIDSDLGQNYDDMLMGKSIDTVDIAHDPHNQDKLLMAHQRSLDMLEENSSPLKLNLKDLKNQHEALIGNHTPTPYGSVAGKYSARDKANALHNLTQRSFISRKRSQEAS